MDITVYIENAKESKQLEIFREFSAVDAIKVDRAISIVCIYDKPLQVGNFKGCCLH